MALQRLVERGKPRRRSAEQAFVAPAKLPADWERAIEGELEVIRLRRDIPPSYSGWIRPLRAPGPLLRDGGDPAAALRFWKGCIVQDEGPQPETQEGRIGYWSNTEAAKACRKLNNSVEECLFLQRAIHHLRSQPKRIPALEARLKRVAAKLQV